MVTRRQHALTSARYIVCLCLRAIGLALFLCCWLPGGALLPQITPLPGTTTDGPSSVHGTVLNRVTHEPISRALVYSPGNQYATLTDDRGHFEFRFLPQQNKLGAAPTRTAPEASTFLNARIIDSRPSTFLARKPGFLSSENELSNYLTPSDLSNITLYLVPESLIVGHVSIPGSEGSVRIRLELYRREVGGGKAHWRQAGSFTTWADGEFRFSELPAGTYKLATTEQLDRDPSIFTITPGEPLFGYPPIFYPASTDFSAATSVQLAAGATFQAMLSPPRHEYFSVKIPVANAPAAQPVEVSVYPLGHPGPGYSLGYNPAEQMIEGMLPNGSYTLQVDVRGQPGWLGIQNFTVSGAALEGSTVNLVPNASLSVNVKEELQSGQSNIQEVITNTAGDGSGGSTPRRIMNVQVMLLPLDEFGTSETASSQQVGDQEQALFIYSVRPGQYRVVVQSAVGYAASVSSGGTDLLREPLVVGMGSANSPIEVTLRDDGAEVQGTIEEDAAKPGTRSDQAGSGRQVFVCFLPFGGTAQFRETESADSKTFTQEQLPPGNYRVVVFDRPQPNLDYASEETLRKFESKGQDISVEAGQKLQIRVKVIQESERP
jgi:hypothetical protein